MFGRLDLAALVQPHLESFSLIGHARQIGVNNIVAIDISDRKASNVCLANVTHRSLSNSSAATGAGAAHAGWPIGQDRVTVPEC